MDKFNSKSDNHRPDYDGNRNLGKPLLRKKNENGEQNNQGNRKSYNNNGNNYNSDRQPYLKRQGSNSYNRYNNSGNSYNENGGREKRSYNNNNYNSNNSNYNSGRPYQQRSGNNANRPYNNPNRYDNNRYGQDQGYNNRQDNVRYDQNNKKVVFRKRKNVSGSEEGLKRKKHFTPFKEEVDLTKPIRLNKFLANAGICSRREADEYIQAGVVTVNGEVVSELGVKVLPTDKVMFHNEPVHTERKIYLILNKPKDYVTTVEDNLDRKIVMDLVKNACNERIYPVGRLDRNTTGVLLFTNDGDLASKLTHPKYEKKKIYQVTLDKDLADEDFNKILEGVELEDGVMKADDLSFIADDTRKKLGIEIHSGKNRIVRRIFDKLNYRVIHLDRVYFAGLTKKNLPRGKYRFLNGKEIASLKMGAYE